jgi:hypothetical protein
MIDSASVRVHRKRRQLLSRRRLTCGGLTLFLGFGTAPVRRANPSRPSQQGRRPTFGASAFGICWERQLSTSIRIPNTAKPRLNCADSGPVAEVDRDWQARSKAAVRPPRPRETSAAGDKKLYSGSGVLQPAPAQHSSELLLTNETVALPAGSAALPAAFCQAAHRLRNSLRVTPRHAIPTVAR